jgi:hypothetical protein
VHQIAPTHVSICGINIITVFSERQESGRSQVKSAGDFPRSEIAILLRDRSRPDQNRRAIPTQCPSAVYTRDSRKLRRLHIRRLQFERNSAVTLRIFRFVDFPKAPEPSFFFSTKRPLPNLCTVD